MSGYELPRHVWGLIREHIADSEVSEVKNVLGDSIIDQTIELRNEIELLMEIWNDIKGSKQLEANRLPEPPSVRELLVREIKLFVDNIREKMSKDEEKLKRTFSNNSVIDYVDRKMSFCSSYVPEMFTSRRLESPEIETNGYGQVTLNNLETTTEHARELLRAEIEMLTEDVAYLQESLENDSRVEIIPSIADLRKERSKLDKLNGQLSIRSQQSTPSLYYKEQPIEIGDPDQTTVSDHCHSIQSRRQSSVSLTSSLLPAVKNVIPSPLSSSPVHLKLPTQALQSPSSTTSSPSPTTPVLQRKQSSLSSVTSLTIPHQLSSLPSASKVNRQPSSSGLRAKVTAPKPITQHIKIDCMKLLSTNSTKSTNYNICNNIISNNNSDNSDCHYKYDKSSSQTCETQKATKMVCNSRDSMTTDKHEGEECRRSGRLIESLSPQPSPPFSPLSTCPVSLSYSSPVIHHEKRLLSGASSSLSSSSTSSSSGVYSSTSALPHQPPSSLSSASSSSSSSGRQSSLQRMKTLLLSYRE